MCAREWVNPFTSGVNANAQIDTDSAARTPIPSDTRHFRDAIRRSANVDLIRSGSSYVELNSTSSTNDRSKRPDELSKINVAAGVFPRSLPRVLVSQNTAADTGMHASSRSTIKVGIIVVPYRDVRSSMTAAAPVPFRYVSSWQNVGIEAPGEGEIAAVLGSFVVLVGQRPRQPSARPPVGDDAHHVGAPAGLLVQSLHGIVVHSFYRADRGAAAAGRMPQRMAPELAASPESDIRQRGRSAFHPATSPPTLSQPILFLGCGTGKARPTGSRRMLPFPVARRWLSGDHHVNSLADDKIGSLTHQTAILPAGFPQCAPRKEKRKDCRIQSRGHFLRGLGYKWRQPRDFQ